MLMVQPWHGRSISNWFNIRVIIAAYLILGAAYSVASPIFEGPDESNHFFVIQHIHQTGRLPVQDSAISTLYVQEGSQPPLYYLAGAVLISGLDVSAANEYVRSNPQVNIGRPGSPGIRLGASGMKTWPNSLGVMGWHVEDDGLGVLFTRDIPYLVRSRMRDATDGFLDRCGLTRRDLAGFVCHPGGAKVLDALEEVFDLAPGAMGTARQVLRDYGNMSAATVLFVLREMMARGLAGRHLMSALGPGFSAAFQVLEG